MSIIYDALKKTEEAINSNLEATPDIKNKHPKSVYQPYILYVAAACVGLAIGNAVFFLLSPSKKLSISQTKSIPQEAAKIIQPKPVAAIPSKTAPVLPIEIKINLKPH